MWIFWLILGVIGALIAAVLLLPIHLIIKNDENNNMLIRYRVLGMTFGEIPKPETPLEKSLKESTGIARAMERLSRRKLLEDTVQSVKELCEILRDLFEELNNGLRRCTAKVFRVEVVCAEDNAADTAIAFGKVSALVYGLSAAVANLIKIRKRGRKLDVRCDFEGGKKQLRYEFVIMVRGHWVLSTLVKLMLKETRRRKTIEKLN